MGSEPLEPNCGQSLTLQSLQRWPTRGSLGSKYGFHWARLQDVAALGLEPPMHNRAVAWYDSKPRGKGQLGEPALGPQLGHAAPECREKRGVPCSPGLFGPSTRAPRNSFPLEPASRVFCLLKLRGCMKELSSSLPRPKVRPQPETETYCQAENGGG